MSNTLHEIIVSRLIYGVSTKNNCEDTLRFIQFFDKSKKDKQEKEYIPICQLDCFSHDPVSKTIQAGFDPTYICGIIVGISYTGVCHINEKAISSAKKIFNDGLYEYNTYMTQKNGTQPISLDSQLILFGEGITQWETN
tara:strand:- start:2216 stop:2632 length:417 start_codon:yes stop_codon:yes gene_type:complete